MTSCLLPSSNPNTCTDSTTGASPYPQSCSSFPPGADSSNAGNMAQNILSKLSGASNNCNISSTNAAAAFEASGPLGFGSVKGSAQISNLEKSGCQVVAALVGNYLNSVYQSRCIIENDVSSSVQSVIVNQSFSETANGQGSSITSFCPPNTVTSWSQSATIQVRSLQHISSASQNAMVSVVQAGLANTANQLTQVKDGYQSTSSGAQSVSAIQNSITSNIQNSSVKDAITKAITEFNLNQSITVNALNGATISNTPCIMDQHASMDLILANIISNAYTNEITDSVSQFLTSEIGQKSKSDNQGVPDDIGAMFASNWGIIVGAIALLIIGVVVIKALKTKGVQDALSRGIGQAGGGLGGARGLSRL